MSFAGLGLGHGQQHFSSCTCLPGTRIWRRCVHNTHTPCCQRCMAARRRWLDWHVHALLLQPAVISLRPLVLPCGQLLAWSALLPPTERAQPCLVDRPAPPRPPHAGDCRRHQQAGLRAIWRRCGFLWRRRCCRRRCARCRGEEGGEGGGGGGRGGCWLAGWLGGWEVGAGWLVSWEVGAGWPAGWLLAPGCCPRSLVSSCTHCWMV